MKNDLAQRKLSYKNRNLCGIEIKWRVSSQYQTFRKNLMIENGVDAKISPAFLREGHFSSPWPQLVFSTLEHCK